MSCVEPAVYGYASQKISTPFSRARAIRRSILGVDRCQFSFPIDFKWLISTGVRSAFPTAIISSSAASTPLPYCRMWTVMGIPEFCSGASARMSSSVV